jgi:hypothetical protein
MPAQIVGVRFPPELRERVVELAGDERGALSAFVRQAVAEAVERDERGPPGKAALDQHDHDHDADWPQGRSASRLSSPANRGAGRRQSARPNR